tara:strand:+ start:444 stop:1013 length:570 start_codon:yes stop_codon:yes gene_type:complete
MKGYMELALGAILLVLMYEKPLAFTEFANSLLGKAIMIIAVGLIAKNNGLASGLLAALIMIILMHETREGMAHGKDKDKDKDTKAKSVTIKPSSADQEKIKKIMNKTCSDDGDCGYAKTMCDNGTCNIKITPDEDDVENKATKKAVKESFSDIRMVEGFRNRESFQNTIEAMKFSNGQTGAGQNAYNQF